MTNYSVLWHKDAAAELQDMPRPLAENIVKNAAYRLSQAPVLLGKPLKGTVNLLWRLAFSQYRIVYTIREQAKEVWVLSVKKRSDIYRPEHIESILNLAMALAGKKKGA